MISAFVVLVGAIRPSSPVCAVRHAVCLCPVKAAQRRNIAMIVYGWPGPGAWGGRPFFTVTMVANWCLASSMVTGMTSSLLPHCGWLARRAPCCAKQWWWFRCPCIGHGFCDGASINQRCWRRLLRVDWISNAVPICWSGTGGRRSLMVWDVTRGMRWSRTCSGCTLGVNITLPARSFYWWTM